MKENKASKTQTNSYEELVFDEWLSKAIDELIIVHPNFFEKINDIGE